MSSPRSSIQTGTAWLGDDAGVVALDVEARATEPTSFAFFGPDFALNAAEPWLVGRRKGELVAPKAAPLPHLTHRVDPSPTAFNDLFEDITARLARDEFRKVVPIVREELRFAGPLSLAMFPRAWARAPGGQFGYGFAFEDEGLCGFTPELLFEVRDGVLRTMALAGTAAAEGPDLRRDPKEMREHALVVSSLRDELASFGRVGIGDTIERVYGRIKHLYTPIEVALARAPGFMDLAVKLHPTPALGGFPRRPALEWLERQAFHVTRRRFGAPFGYVDGDEMKCVVAIRGLEWHGSTLSIAAGCGIVEGSRVEREWRELELKRRAIYTNLGLNF